MIQCNLSMTGDKKKFKRADMISLYIAISKSKLVISSVVIFYSLLNLMKFTIMKKIDIDIVLILQIVFSMFKFYIQQSQTLGISPIHAGQYTDMFRHENNTLYFAILPSALSRKNIHTFNQLYSENGHGSDEIDLLEILLNLDHANDNDIFCIMNGNNVLVYANGRVSRLESLKKGIFDSTVAELRKKQMILKNMNIEADEVILFSTHIPGYDLFWVDYSKLKESDLKKRYIIDKMGFQTNIVSYMYAYGIFYTDKNDDIAIFRLSLGGGMKIKSLC